VSVINLCTYRSLNNVKTGEFGTTFWHKGSDAIPVHMATTTTVLGDMFRTEQLQIVVV
jgi:hypothetical protein